MGYKVWGELTSDEQSDVIERHSNGESIDDLASAFNLRAESLGRKLRSINQAKTKVLDVSCADMVIQDDQRIFIYGDTHFGEHDPIAIKTALRVAEEFQPDIIVNLGDTVDASRVSKYAKDPRSAGLQQERELWFDFAEQLNNVTNPKSRWMIIGNHDMRYLHSILSVDGLTEMPELTFESFFQTREFGYNTPVDLIYLNRQGNSEYPNAVAYLMHGEFARKGSGSSVRATSDMFSGANTVIGHTHRTAFVTRRTAHGLVAGYEIGTLAKLNPSYMIFPDWSQSVATGVVGKDYLSLNLHVIVNGEVVLNGRKISVR